MIYESKKDGKVVCRPETKKDAYLIGIAINHIEKGIITMIDGELISITFSIRNLFDSILKLITK